MKIIRKTILNVDVDASSNALTEGIVSSVQHAAAIKTANETSNKNSFPLRPSSALKSKRDLYYGLVNYYKPGTIPQTGIEGRSCMLLNLGHLIEKHLVDYLSLSYKIPYKGHKVTYGIIKTASGGTIELGGELDFVLELPGSGELVICDSKSSADFPFKKTDLPKDEHIAQINLYMHSAWARQMGINRAMVFYYNKNDSNIKVLEFNYDPTLANAVIARFQSVYDNYERGELPDVEYVLGVDWQAQYSAFRDWEWASYATKESERSVVRGIKASDIPKNPKAKLEWLVKNYQTSVVETDAGSRLYAEKVGSNLFLRETDSEGFSS